MSALYQRRADWRSALEAYLLLVSRRKFRPGRHDCALFAAGAVKAMTGDDPAKGFRRSYTSLRAGQDLLAAAGYGDHVDMLAALFVETSVAAAAVGDIAVIEEGDALALGVVQGACIYVLKPSGLAIVPRVRATRVFRV